MPSADLLRSALIAVVLGTSTGGRPAAAGPGEPRDLEGDTWVATDPLGRELPGHGECGPPKPGRHAGIFYFLWHGQHGARGPFDVTRILAADRDNPAWGPPGTFHHWGKPELGYYLSTDEYVIRRHAHLLGHAGIDVVIFDVTNGFTYDACYETLCRVYREMRAEGSSTPQIAFLTNSGSERVVRHLYERFYSKERYRELWFRWADKPLMLSKTDDLGHEILEFFTFRRSWAWSDAKWFGDGRDRWPWLDHFPQKPGWHRKGKPEEVPVAVAQHPVTNIGRSFHDGRQPPPSALRTAEGLCFEEQWRRALDVDPEFVFVTGWNEWVAQRFIAKEPQGFLGRTLEAGETYFVDQFNQEYSRDIEPMEGGHSDSYYYQLVANVRRYKGVRRPTPRRTTAAISVDGDFSDWAAVGPEYRDASHDTTHRDHPGWGQVGRYRDTTGRNDFVTLKVAHDEENVYFYAQTREAITPPAGPSWMLLLIDRDQNARTGWEGYDLVVNHEVTDVSWSGIHAWTGGDSLEPAGRARRAVRGREIELAVPRALLGKEEPTVGVDDGPSFDFHWADNISRPGDTRSLLTEGDSAPDRRFKYRYR